MGRHRCAAKANDGSSRTPRRFLARAVRVPHRSDEALSVMPRRPLIRRWTAQDSALLAEMLREGKTCAQIARRMRLSASAIRNHARRLAESFVLER